VYFFVYFFSFATLKKIFQFVHTRIVVVHI